MITMMFGGPPSGFDPASSESDSPEATVAFAMMATVNSDSIFKIEFSVLVVIEATVCRLPRAVLL